MHTVLLGAVLNTEAVGNLVKKRNIARRLLGLGESELNIRQNQTSYFDYITNEKRQYVLNSDLHLKD